MSATVLPVGPALATPADQRVRDRIRSDLETTLIIEAAAGTGKTTALVSRIVAVIASGRSMLDRVVAVTFTEKAAGELKLRLRAEIERARHQDPDPAARERLTASLEKLEEARIGTIHSFCADLLRERPVEAAVDPMFEVAAEDATSVIFSAAFDRWFERALANPGEGLRRILRRPNVTDRDGPRPLLRAAAQELLEWRDFDTPWQHAPFDRDREIDTLVDEIDALGALAAEGDSDDWLRKALELLRRPISEATRLEAVRDRDYDALEAALLRLVRGDDRHWRWRGSGPRFGDLARAEVFARRDALRLRLNQFRDRAGASLAPLLRDELWPVVDYYRKLKERAGRLDFLDLLLTARNLVRDNPAVRTELQSRFTHIFVDEFQDTDPLQAEILLLLAAADPAATDWLEVHPHPGKLFIVGDPKQSIYRFRRADVALYQEIKRRLLERGAALENLSVSFRATPEIQSMVNAAFAPAMAADSPTQPGYVALEPFRPAHPEQPAIIALPVPSPYSQYGRITNWSIEDSLPDGIAAFVKWLVEESGWTVTEREAPDRRVAIRPRHVCILFRRLSAYGRDVTRNYVRALEARHVPHVLVRGGSFHMREEVETIRNALAAVERPDDELAMFATLHGALFAIADGTLLRFRETYRSLNPFRPLPDDLPETLREVAGALAIIGGLHRGRNRRPIAETIARLLDATRAHAAFAIWPTGDQALANVMRLMDMARRYEAISGATSMRGFVEDLEERAEREETGEVPVVEEGTEGVRIMTVHRAKGLEFPVVILADITCHETAAEARRYVDPVRRLCAQRLGGQAPGELLDHADEELRRDEEEAVRLLYVAATRARDLIVAPVVGDEPHNGWIGRLNPALYPDTRNSRAPLERRAPGCPEFRSEIAGSRPDNAFTRSSGVTPGLHRPEAGTHRVVWWDTSVLALDAHETMGLTQTRLLEADAQLERSERGTREYAVWRQRRDELISVGAVPLMRVASATELSAGAVAGDESGGAAKVAPGAPAQIEIVRVPRAAMRPRGTRFGTLVHAILAQVALTASSDAVSATARFFGRIFNAPEEEVAAAAATVTAALASPLMRRAAAATVVRREAPTQVVLPAAAPPASPDVPSGSAIPATLVEGIADLAFLELRDGAARWIVIDFKTDFDVDRRIAEYRVQLGLYMRAITRATAIPTAGYLFLI